MMKLKVLVCLLALTTAPTLHAFTVINQTEDTLDLVNFWETKESCFLGPYESLITNITTPITLEHTQEWTAPVEFKNTHIFEFKLHNDPARYVIEIENFNTLVVTISLTQIEASKLILVKDGL